MTTWRLWQALKAPPATHPIYHWLTNMYGGDLYTEMRFQNLIVQAQIWFWPLLFVVDNRTLILMIFSGTLYGAVWAMSISGTIVNQRNAGIYDLLCLSPAGTAGINWMICTGCLHHRKGLQQANSQEAWVIRCILFIPLVVSANLILGRMLASTGAVSITWLVALLAVFYLDHIQSIILGSLFGLLAPHYAPSRFDTRLWALGGFMMFQILTWIVLIITGTILLPTLYNTLQITGVYADITLPVFVVVIFYSIRESVTQWLWRILTHELNAAPIEVQSLIHTAIAGEWTVAR